MGLHAVLQVKCVHHVSPGHHGDGLHSRHSAHAHLRAAPHHHVLPGEVGAETHWCCK